MGIWPWMGKEWKVQDVTFEYKYVLKKREIDLKVKVKKNRMV